MDLSVRIGVGAALSLLIALVAARRGSLSRSGAVAAIVTGTLIYVGGGAAWFLALVTFFVSSTLLGRVGRARKAAVKREFEKGDTRDAWQVLSNGGAAAACALGMALRPDTLWAAGFLGALATANADTWATELGVLSRADPWSLRTLRRVPRGTSGAVSAWGLVVTLAGGTLIGSVAALGRQQFGAMPAGGLIGLGAFTGFAGALLDSVLGATLQTQYYCAACGRDTEGPRHACGAQTEHARGLRGFDNDRVNLMATLGGALLAGLSVWLLR